MELQKMRNRRVSCCCLPSQDALALSRRGVFRRTSTRRCPWAVGHCWFGLPCLPTCKSFRHPVILSRRFLTPQKFPNYQQSWCQRGFFTWLLSNTACDIQYHGVIEKQKISSGSLCSTNRQTWRLNPSKRAKLCKYIFTSLDGHGATVLCWYRFAQNDVSLLTIGTELHFLQHVGCYFY